MLKVSHMWIFITPIKIVIIEIKIQYSFKITSTEKNLLLFGGVLHYFLNRFTMDGALRRLGRSIDFEAARVALGTLEAVVVIGLAEALEVLATTEPMEFSLFRTPPRRGVVFPIDRLDTLLDTGKEVKDFLAIADSRISPVGELFPQILVPGAEIETRCDSLGLPAVVSETLKKLPTLISFSCVLLGAGGVLAEADFIPQRFTGFGVTRSCRPV